MKQDVLTGPGSLNKLADITGKNYSSVFVLCDENTLTHCYAELSGLLPPHKTIRIQSGEEHKNIVACQSIWQELTLHEADRKALLVNLGGGMLCDVGGFAAACYKRGIAFVNIPTTLLAMVDASVGGKTGIDFAGYKNQIGLFYHPIVVAVHTSFLRTLPERELISGLAEIIKHYLIADKEQFAQLYNTRPDLSKYLTGDIIATNIAIKQQITEEDPFEKGPRKALNFGHTVGHAVESYFLNTPEKRLLHGEAVAVGILAESYISMKTGTLSKNELSKICEVFNHYFKLPLIPETIFSDLLKLMMQDKKNNSGTIRFTLLNAIGSFSIDKIVEEAVIIESLRYYNSLHT